MMGKFAVEQAVTVRDGGGLWAGERHGGWGGKDGRIVTPRIAMSYLVYLGPIYGFRWFAEEELEAVE